MVINKIKTSNVDYLYRLLCLLMGIFIMYYSYKLSYFSLKLPFGNILHIGGAFFLGLLIYIVAFIKLQEIKDDKIIISSIFILAIIPRLIGFFFIDYVPTSDFTNYYLFSKYFHNGEYEKIANIIAIYQLKSFSGLAIFNGILGWLFTPTIQGLRIANICITSLISVCLYIMIPKNYKSAAIFAALAFSYYPSNIISTQILTNHHAEVLMSLIGILLYQASIEKPTPKVFLHFLLCGFFFAVGNLIHRTVTVILIAVIIHTLLSIDITTYKRKILGAIIIIVGYMVTTQACYSYSYAIGILNKNCRYLESNDYLIHLAIGLNQETHGRFGSPEEHIIYKHINYKNFILMPAEDQHRIILKVIKERLRDPQLVKLISYKIFATWFYTDEYVSYWYRSSDVLKFSNHIKNNTISAEEIILKNQSDNNTNSLCLIDNLYLIAIYILCIYALFTYSKKISSIPILQLLILILCGWILLVALFTMQPRYRYSTMPYFITIASFSFWPANKCGFFKDVLQSKPNNP